MPGRIVRAGELKGPDAQIALTVLIDPEELRTGGVDQRIVAIIDGQAAAIVAVPESDHAAPARSEAGKVVLRVPGDAELDIALIEVPGAVIDQQASGRIAGDVHQQIGGGVRRRDERGAGEQGQGNLAHGVPQSSAALPKAAITGLILPRAQKKKKTRFS